MKKILYVITSLSHKRVFESFIHRDDVEQLVIGPHPKITSGIVPEDYRDFKLNVKTYGDKNEKQKLVNKFNPDVYVQASIPVGGDIKLPKCCKRVYVSHGLVGNHVKNIIKSAGFKISSWKGCDLYCGASDTFFYWLKDVVKTNENKMLLNVLPQLDIIYNKNYYESYKQIVLKKTKNPNAKKTILFIGFEGKDRVDFIYHNEDYFASVIKIEEICRKNNWLGMIKPRHTFKFMMKFLKSHSWGKKYIEKYKKIQNSKYLHFITTTGHIYRYFFADYFVLNGCSTTEIEACVINKPLFIIRTNKNVFPNKYDPFDTINSGAACHVDKIEKLECFISNYSNNIKLQNDLIKKMGICFDGNNHKRCQDFLKKL